MHASQPLTPLLSRWLLGLSCTCPQAAIIPTCLQEAGARPGRAVSAFFGYMKVRQFFFLMGCWCSTCPGQQPSAPCIAPGWMAARAALACLSVAAACPNNLHPMLSAGREEQPGNEARAVGAAAQRHAGGYAGPRTAGGRQQEAPRAALPAWLAVGQDLAGRQLQACPLPHTMSPLLPTNHPCAGPKGRRGDQVGGFTLMNVADLRRVAPLWLKYTEDVRFDPDVSRYRYRA